MVTPTKKGCPRCNSQILARGVVTNDYMALVCAECGYMDQFAEAVFVAANLIAEIVGETQLNDRLKQECIDHYNAERAKKLKAEGLEKFI